MVMKKKLLTATAIVLTMVSCAKEKSAGGISFDVFSDVDLEEAVKSKVSDFAALPPSSDFKLEINDATQKIWEGKLSEWSPATSLTVGSYSVRATYGSATEEGTAKPYFVGSTNFSIEGGATTTVKIPVELGNCIVKIVCTEKFKNYFTNGKFTVTTGNGSQFDVTKDSSNAIFMEAYKFTLTGDFLNQGGAQQKFEKVFEDLSAGTLYTLNFDAANIGGLTITITFNDNVTTVDLGSVEINN